MVLTNLVIIPVHSVAAVNSALISPLTLTYSPPPSPIAHRPSPIAPLSTPYPITHRRSGSAAQIVTDGVFSMDGNVAPMRDMCDLADQYGAIVLTDECHATGFFGKTGRGVPEYFGIEGV